MRPSRNGSPLGLDVAWVGRESSFSSSGQWPTRYGDWAFVLIEFSPFIRSPGDSPSKQADTIARSV